MCNGGIAWCQFSWEAFATLTTGLAAVSAASVVGWRQGSIQKTQAAIQETQTRIQAMALKADLFERRSAVYERVECFLSYICINSNAPKPRDEIEHNFLISKGKANFLFDQPVIDGLQEIWEKACHLHALNVQMDHLNSTTGHFGDDNIQRMYETNMWFTDRLTKLPDLFAEMKLGGDL